MPGEWLYKHTSIPTTQQLVLKLVAAYGKSLHPQGDVVDNLRQSIREKPYIFLTLDFVGKMASPLPMAEPSSLERLNRQVTEKLNQEFLRCRLGGLYNTVPGCWDMYFRISNPTFDWEPGYPTFFGNPRGKTRNRDGGVGRGEHWQKRLFHPSVWKTNEPYTMERRHNLWRNTVTKPASSLFATSWRSCGKTHSPDPALWADHILLALGHRQARA